MSPAEIKQKAAALEGVLVPLPAEWYTAVLQRCGFVEVRVLHARLGFVTWMASKPRHATTGGDAAAGGADAPGKPFVAVAQPSATVAVATVAVATVAVATVAVATVAVATVAVAAVAEPLAAVTVAAAAPEQFVWWPDFARTSAADCGVGASGAARVAYEGGTNDAAPFAFAAWGKVAWGNASDEAAARRSWRNDKEGLSVYGFVTEGPATLTRLGATRFECTLDTGMYFSCPGGCEVRGGAGILSLAPDGPAGVHRALFSLGGPVAAGTGRLPYIDGCTDTLLLSPPRRGAPCLNHLHFPPAVKQTRHTHPSGRTGVVIAGEGVCVVDGAGGGKERRVPLRPGTAFVIPTDLPHAFETVTLTLALALTRLP